VGSAPAVVTIRTRIEPNAENRSLNSWQSGDYFRARGEPRRQQRSARERMVFRGIPEGRYAVTASPMARSSAGAAVLWFEATAASRDSRTAGAQNVPTPRIMNTDN
jgi:hypothetical protein